MGWQPAGGDKQEDKPEEDLPVASRLWLENDFKNVTQLVTIITIFQQIHGALATTNATEKESEEGDGSEVLYMFGVIMVILGMVLMKVLQRCRVHWGEADGNLAIRRMRVADSVERTSSSTRPSTSLREGRGERLRAAEGPQRPERGRNRETSTSSSATTSGGSGMELGEQGKSRA